MTLGCSTVWTELPAAELEARERLEQTPIALEGWVVGAEGPIAGAEVEAQGLSAVSEADGRFRLFGLRRDNALVTLSAAGFRDRVLAAQLLQPVTEQRLDLGVLALTQDRGARLRMVGDVSLGRRFLDPDETAASDELPEDHPEALIQVSEPYDGSAATLDYVRRFFDDADYATCNLETVVTDTPDTPHTGKPYIFFTLPGSLPALAEVFDYIAEGNNHVYDYLDGGVEDTLAWAAGSTMGFSGLGRDSEEAFAGHEVELSGQAITLLSMTSVAGSQYEVGFVATEERGGAADLRDDERVLAAVRGAREAGRAAILQLHFGKEYSEEPSGYALDRLALLEDAGAALIVGHHPHIAQGFGWHGETLAAHSLGNFIFDQDRLETMLGLIWRVDLVDQAPFSSAVAPIYLEDYRPRPLVGRPADRLLRQVASVSVDVELALTGGQASLGGLDLALVERRRSETVTVEIGEDGIGWVDLRGLLEPGESLWYAGTEIPGVTAQAGRDVLIFGGFEDVDVDEDWLEASRWDLEGASKDVCVDQAFRGAGALCSLRGEDNTEHSISWFRNRVRLPGGSEEPVRELSLVGQRRGEGAGETSFVIEWVASEGDLGFGEEILAVRAGGDFDWEPLFVDLEVPADEPEADPATETARALRLEVHHAPPESDLGMAWFDELALVSWGVEGSPSEGWELPSPNPSEHIRLVGAPGEVALNLGFKRLEPAR